MAKARTGKVITYADGRWRKGSPAILNAKSHAMWLASVAFDGARAFAGVAPDLDRHCARVVRSASILGLASPLTAGEIEALAWEGIHRFPDRAELYICPMLYAESGFVIPDPHSTRFAMTGAPDAAIAPCNASTSSAVISPSGRAPHGRAPGQASPAATRSRIAFVQSPARRSASRPVA